MDKDQKPVYVKCPRCELNYILKKDKYCEVCKKEMKAGAIDDFEYDDFMDEEMELCPVCKTNYLQDGETICAMCLEENSTNSKDEDVDWRTFVDKADEDDDLDLLPVENDEIDEELDSQFAEDLDDDFAEDEDDLLGEDEFNDVDDDFNVSMIDDDSFDEDDDEDYVDDDEDDDEDDDIRR